MNTLVAMVSTGERTHLTRSTFPRLYRWAERNGYNCVLVKDHLEGDGRVPHYGKLKVCDAFKGFDRYCVVDDDILISGNAPQLPEVPSGYVGMAKDSVQTNTTNPLVQWTGNTGFLVFDKIAARLVLQAYESGDDPSIWPGFADQSAVNSVLWSCDRAYQIDGRWNYMPVLDYYHRRGSWERWTSSRLFRLALYANLGLNPFGIERKSITECWGCHLIRAPYPRFFDAILP